MRYIENLNEETRSALHQGHKHGKGHQFRNRCQAILLSEQGYTVAQLAAMFQVSNLSIYKWFNRFEASGVAGLKNQSGRGRRPLLRIENQIHRQVVADYIE